MLIYEMYMKRDFVFLSAHSQCGRIFSLELQIAIKEFKGFMKGVVAWSFYMVIASGQKSFIRF